MLKYIVPFVLSVIILFSCVSDYQYEVAVHRILEKNYPNKEIIELPSELDQMPKYLVVDTCGQIAIVTMNGMDRILSHVILKKCK